MSAWDVYYRGRHVNRVYYTRDCDAAYVCSTLINHDGYPAGIIVRRG